MNERITLTRNDLQQAEYKLGEALDDVRGAQRMYREALTDECIEGILRIQIESGEVTKRDLQIFIRDLLSKVGDIKVR